MSFKIYDSRFHEISKDFRRKGYGIFQVNFDEFRRILRDIMQKGLRKFKILQIFHTNTKKFQEVSSDFKGFQWILKNIKSFQRIA